MEWGELVFQAMMTVALVGWIKALTKDSLGQWAVLVSMGAAFIIVYLAMAESFVLLDYIRQSLYVGLGAAGMYKIAGKVSNSTI